MKRRKNITIVVALLLSLDLHAQSGKDIAVDKMTQRKVDYAAVAEKLKTQDAIWNFRNVLYLNVNGKVTSMTINL